MRYGARKIEIKTYKMLGVTFAKIVRRLIDDAVEIKNNLS
jgi:hypothetical protein